MTCKDTTWLVSDSRERRLSQDEKDGLDRHIATCPYCRGASTHFDVLFRQIDRMFKPDAQDSSIGL